MKDEWRTLEKFKQYNDSLTLLSTEDKGIAMKKLTHMFTIMENSLHKHFRPWVRDLFFLSTFSNQPTAQYIVRRLLGRPMNISTNEVVNYYDNEHRKDINLPQFITFLNERVDTNTINETRCLPLCQEIAAALSLIANGIDIWTKQINIPCLSTYSLLYLHRYSALPTNTQFGERGVKESGYVSLGRRNEANRSVLAISRGKLLPEALALGREEIRVKHQDEEKQLQGKAKTRVLMAEFHNHEDCIQKLLHKRKRDGNNIVQERKKVKRSLTHNAIQFKVERTKKQLDSIITKVNNNPAPNVYERRSGQTLTPLIDGRIQYGKMLKKYNTEAIQGELQARGLGDKFDDKTNWTTLIKLLKEHEKDKRYFRPLTDYNKFKWNCNHIGLDGELL